MAIPNFINQVTIITSAWLNQVSQSVFGAIGDGTNPPVTKADVLTNLGLSGSTGAGLVGFVQAGAGAVSRTLQSKERDVVNVADFGAINGGDMGAAANLAIASGATRIKASGVYTLSNQILLNGKTGITLDFSDATITAAALLNVTLINFINSTYCTVLLGKLDGNAAGQTASSFGISFNGGNHNKAIGGRTTNCKTYGAYNIGSSYSEWVGLTADNNQQAGIAGDVGGSDVIGLKVLGCTTYSNGLGGAGTLNGVYFEGNPTTGFYYRELEISDLVSYDNRGSGLAGQNWRGYILSNISCSLNYKQGISLAACSYGTGGGFSLYGNSLAGFAGYQNGLSIDDAGVTPPSQYNSFTGIASRSHVEYAVIERGTANNNSFFAVDSVGDGGIFAIVGSNTVTQNRQTFNILKASGPITSTTPAGGIGYSTGAGGTVAQATNKNTSVTLNALSGRITTTSDALAAGALAQFTLLNTSIASTDILMFNVVSGATQAAYVVNARPVNGQAAIEIRNITAGSLAEGLVIAFNVFKGAIA